MMVYLFVFAVSYPHSFASFYVKVMKKVLDKGNEYIQKEYERLGRILGMSDGCGGGVSLVIHSSSHQSTTRDNFLAF